MSFMVSAPINHATCEVRATSRVAQQVIIRPIAAWTSMDVDGVYWISVSEGASVMAKAPKKDGDNYTEEEAARRFEQALKGAASASKTKSKAPRKQPKEKR